MGYVVLILLAGVWAVALTPEVVRSWQAHRGRSLPQRRSTLRVLRLMTLTTTQRKLGRQLMVPDDAESIARGARRRARQRARQRQLLQQLVTGGVVVAIGALIMGAPVTLVLGVAATLSLAAVVAYQRLREHEDRRRRRQVRATPGSGIGARRPDGAFSITRRRGPDPAAAARSRFGSSPPSKARAA